MDQWIPLVISASSALASAGSAAIAIAATRLQQRRGTVEAFTKISNVFETKDFRRYRVAIYQLDRMAFTSWSEAECHAVDAWAAHLDLIAVLIQAKQLNRESILNMYGDVIARTLYQIAPYCNAQVKIRGRQFMLPTRVFVREFVKLWRRQAEKNLYPLTIGFPSQPNIRTNPDIFDSDDEMVLFRIEKPRRRPRR
jgi:hypothetical protein